MDPTLSKPLTHYQVFADAFMKRPESLSHFLPYEEYLEDLKLFRQKDTSLGVVYEVDLCEHETKTGDEITGLLERLRNWFKLQDDLTLSIYFEQARISPHDPTWASQMTSVDTERGDLPATLHLASIDRLRTDVMPFKRKLYISIRTFQKLPTTRSRIKRLSEEFANPMLTLGHEAKTFLKNARDFNHTLSQFEMSTPLSMRRITAEKLADVLRRIFNPVTYYKRPFAAINPNISISNQLVFSSSTINHSGIDREGIQSRTITLKNAPSFAYPGSMAYFLGLNFPFRICLNVSFPSSASVKRHFGLKEFFLQNTPSAKSRRLKAEVDIIQERLVRDDRVLQMTFNVLLDAESQNALDLQTKEALSHFQQHLECEAIVESDIGFGLWLNALPLCYHPITDFTANRSVKILSSDIAHFCPVFDSFRGMKTAQSTFMSRESGLVPFNLKEHGNSHMTVVLGDTGSAKSGQVIKLLLGELRKDPKPMIFVIDHKTSYGMVSKFLPSELTTFERDKPFPFSPFRGNLDEDKIRFLVQLLSSAMAMSSTSFVLESEHRTCLTQAIRDAYSMKASIRGVHYEAGDLIRSADAGQAEVNLDDIISCLGALTSKVEFEKYGSTIDEINKKLRTFYGDGIHASFFRSNQSAPDGKPVDLYVYDLDALSGDPILQTLVTMSVIEEIRRKIQTSDAKARGGFIVIEEIGMLGRNNPVAKDFVIDAAETFRKLGFFLIGLSPNPRNYFETEAGKAMWAVADHYIFLAMKEDNVDFVAKNSSLLDDASKQVVKSLRTMRGQYADLFYIDKSRSFKGAFRNVPSAHELWLMPTHLPDALEAQKTLDRFNGDASLALADLVKRYPTGTKDILGGNAK